MINAVAAAAVVGCLWFIKVLDSLRLLRLQLLVATAVAVAVAGYCLAKF